MKPQQALLGQRLTGFLLATISAFCFALLNVSIRYCEPYLTVWQIMFARSLFGLAAMWLLASLGRYGLRGQNRKTLIAAGVFSVFNVLCLTAAIFLLPLFEALVLLYLYPLVAALVSPAINGDRFRSSDWGLILLGLVGTILVLWSGGLGNRFSLGHLLGLGAACGYGLMTTLIRKVMSVNNPLTPYFYICLVGSLVCAVPALWSWRADVALPAAGWGALIAVSLFGTLAYLASNKALAYLPSPKVGVISMTEVIFSSLFGLWLFQEHLGARALTGGVLIMLSGVLLSIRPDHQPPGQTVH